MLAPFAWARLMLRQELENKASHAVAAVNGTVQAFSHGIPFGTLNDIFSSTTQ
jgi:hypothetical protein